MFRNTSYSDKLRFFFTFLWNDVIPEDVQNKVLEWLKGVGIKHQLLYTFWPLRLCPKSSTCICHLPSNRDNKILLEVDIVPLIPAAQCLCNVLPRYHMMISDIRFYEISAEQVLVHYIDIELPDQIGIDKRWQIQHQSPFPTCWIVLESGNIRQPLAINFFPLWIAYSCAPHTTADFPLRWSAYD